MTSTKHLLNVLMDGIKDSEKLLHYSREAESEGHASRAEWFKERAEKRINSLKPMYDYISDEMGMESKIAEGDEMACVFHNHICEQITGLRLKLENM